MHGANGKAYGRQTQAEREEERKTTRPNKAHKEREEDTMRKQVEGHTSRVAPANRHIYTQYIKFTKFEKNARPTTTEDITRALKWYENGNTVSVIVVMDGFKMDRPQNFAKTSTGNYMPYNGMMPSIREKVYATWNKKTQPIEPKHLKYIENANHEQIQVNTF